MKKILIAVTILLVSTLLLCGMYLPNTPLMWMASTALHYSYIRAGLIAVLCGLLFTNPPRAFYFRAALGMIALILGVATVYMLFTDQLYVIDAVVFLEIAVICGLEALESTSARPMKLLTQHPTH
jgi:hypothetical protein